MNWIGGAYQARLKNLLARFTASDWLLALICLAIVITGSVITENSRTWLDSADLTSLPLGGYVTLFLLVGFIAALHNHFRQQAISASRSKLWEEMINPTFLSLFFVGVPAISFFAGTGVYSILLTATTVLLLILVTTMISYLLQRLLPKFAILVISLLGIWFVFYNPVFLTVVQKALLSSDNRQLLLVILSLSGIFGVGVVLLETFRERLIRRRFQFVELFVFQSFPSHSGLLSMWMYSLSRILRDKIILLLAFGSWLISGYLAASSIASEQPILLLVITLTPFGVTIAYLAEKIKIRLTSHWAHLPINPIVLTSSVTLAGIFVYGIFTTILAEYVLILSFGDTLQVLAGALVSFTLASFIPGIKFTERSYGVMKMSWLLLYQLVTFITVLVLSLNFEFPLLLIILLLALSILITTPVYRERPSLATI